MGILKKFRQQRLWMVLILGISTIFSLTGDLTLYATLPVNAGNLLLTLGQVGVILSANRFIRLLSNPITGILLDKGRRRTVYLYGLLLGVVSTLFYALTQQFAVMFIGRLIWGFAWSFIHVTGKTMVIDVTKVDDRGRYLGFLNLLISLGLSINPLLGGFLAETLGFQPTMLLSALLSALGLVLALVFLPEFHNRVEDTHQVVPETQPGYAPAQVRFYKHLWQGMDLSGLTAPVWLAVGLTFITAFAGFGLVMSTVGLLIAQESADGMVLFGRLIGAASLTGLLMGLRAILIALSSPIAGAYSDRKRSRWPTVLAALVLGMLGMGAFGILPVQLAVMAGIGLMAVAEGILLTVLPAVVGDQADKAVMGKAVSVLYVAGDLASAIAPMLVYSLVMVVPLRMVYLTASLAFGLGVGLVMIRNRRNKHPRAG